MTLPDPTVRQEHCRGLLEEYKRVEEQIDSLSNLIIEKSKELEKISRNLNVYDPPIRGFRIGEKIKEINKDIIYMDNKQKELIRHLEFIRNDYRISRCARFLGHNIDQ